MPRLSRRNVRKGGKGRKGKGGMYSSQQPTFTRSDSSGSYGEPPNLPTLPRDITQGPRPHQSQCAREHEALRKCERGEPTSVFSRLGLSGGRKSRRRGRKSHRRGRKSRRHGGKSRRRSRR